MPIKTRSLNSDSANCPDWRHPDPNTQNHQKIADYLRDIIHMLKFDGNVSVGGVIAGESRQESLKGIWMDFDKFSYTKALLQ